MDFSLTNAEQEAADKFLNKRDVKSLLKRGGVVFLEFHQTGIGRALTIHVRRKRNADEEAFALMLCQTTADEVLSKNITDYNMW